MSHRSGPGRRHAQASSEPCSHHHSARCDHCHEGWSWLRKLYWALLLLAAGCAICRSLTRPGPRDRKGASKDTSGARAQGISPYFYRRPDPMIYAQQYLMDQGIAVTWDNPDIHLERGGTPVLSSDLAANTEYDVVARIWNGSLDAPAVNLPVTFSYLAFGIGMVSVPIGRTLVDLPVRGAPGSPVEARMRWTTPSAPGHYCLQVELAWGDDANPLNNLGQENTDVRALNSPHAALTFPVRNGGLATRLLMLDVDAYAIPERPRCDPEERVPSPRLTQDARDRRRRETVARHDRSAFPVPEGWSVRLEPNEMSLEPGEERDVTVDITAPDAFSGRQTFNVNAFDDSKLVGGVTLTVEG